jgi:hypothetical protein
MAAAKKAKPKSKSKPAKKAPAKKPAISRKAKAPAKKPAAKKAAGKKHPATKSAVKPPAPRKAPVARLSAVAVAAPRAPAKPVPAAVPDRGPLPGEEPVGVVTHYFGHLSVAVVRLDTGSLQIGDTIRILGHTTDFRQRVDSLQVEHESVTEVGRRQEFGLKVKEHVREHDAVYKVAAP